MTALRVITGGLMAGHGIQKLRNLEPTAKGFDFMGLRPGQQHAIAAGVVETAAGASPPSASSSSTVPGAAAR